MSRINFDAKGLFPAFAMKHEGHECAVAVVIVDLPMFLRVAFVFDFARIPRLFHYNAIPFVQWALFGKLTCLDGQFFCGQCGFLTELLNNVFGINC